MIIFLEGPDFYRRHQKTKELIDFYQKKHSNFDFKRFDFSDNQEDHLALKDFFLCANQE